MYKVDKIELFVKKEFEENPNAVPLQTVHFAYSYDLCQGVPNNALQGGGKLTLKRVWMTYQGNNRGSLSPYEFTYGEHGSGQISNPQYSEDKYNRWGGYKEYNSDFCDNSENPYVDQFRNDHLADVNGQQVLDPELAKKQHREQQDLWATAWNLTSIKLPSGGTIKIEYESDDYAYVQHKKAAQMFKVVSTRSDEINSELFNKNNWDAGTPENYNNLKLYFDLEELIRVREESDEKVEISERFKRDYLDPLKTPNGEYQLFFNSKVLFKENFEDYVSGFLKLRVYSSDNVTSNSFKHYGPDESSIKTVNGKEYYTKGFVTLEPIKSRFWLQTTPKYFHPIAYLAWEKMKEIKPEIIIRSEVHTEQT
jgi:hypothetical protein